MGIAFRNLIDGQWMDGEPLPDVNPSDITSNVGNYACAAAHDMSEAIDAANAAFPAWSRSTPPERHAVLQKASVEILARREELGRLLSSEEGKTLAEGIGEAMRAGQIFDFFAGEALRLGGETIMSLRSGVSTEVYREPVGVVGVITPWNFPIAIPAWKIAPALCYGNAVVFKPANLVPGCAWALADILQRAGLPAGVLNLVMGRGSDVGQTLLDSDKISAVTFTGSVATGRKVGISCAERNRKVQLEMGGKNPLVVLDDADLERSVECALNGAFYSTGQRCTASSRLIVQDRIHDSFVAALSERMQTLVVGHALDSRTDIGPAVDENQLAQNEQYVAIGLDEGAKLITGGRRVERETPGFYMEPALFTETHNKMRICREEIFGPVASVIRVGSYDEALEIANDTEFGLSSGICTSSLKHAAHFKANSQAGMVMVNLPTAGVDFNAPFGGRKGSSLGPREQGRYAVEFYTAVKTAYTSA